MWWWTRGSTTDCNVHCPVGTGNGSLLASHEAALLKAKFPTREDRQKRAKRAALRALKKARRAAETAGVKLSDWEGEFLGSVETRVEKYGRAFRDPEKGGPGASLSMLQTVKLKEIAGKAAGKKKPWQRKIAIS